MFDSTESISPKLQPAPAPPPAENISGRGVFVIDTVAAGVAVRTAFLAEDGRLIEIPAVFPDLMYAMAQIDELRQLVINRFAEAAQIGSQLIAQQMEINRAQSLQAATNQAEPKQQADLTQIQTRDQGKDSAKESIDETKSVLV